MIDSDSPDWGEHMRDMADAVRQRVKDGDLPPIGPVANGCACCPPKPATAPLDWMPHPGFGGVSLLRDGATPDWWDEYCDLHEWSYYIDKGWTTVTTFRGKVVEYFDGGEHINWAVESVTLREIEECVAEDPDHDWRLRIDGPMVGVIYQRQGCAQWVAVERLDGFA